MLFALRCFKPWLVRCVGGTLHFPAFTDSQGNSYALDRLLTSKFLFNMRHHENCDRTRRQRLAHESRMHATRAEHSDGECEQRPSVPRSACTSWSLKGGSIAVPCISSVRTSLAVLWICLFMRRKPLSMVVRRSRNSSECGGGRRSGGQRPGEHSPPPSKRGLCLGPEPTVSGGPRPLYPEPSGQAPSSGSVSDPPSSCVLLSCAASLIALSLGGDFCRVSVALSSSDPLTCTERNEQ